MSGELSTRQKAQTLVKILHKNPHSVLTQCLGCVFVPQCGVRMSLHVGIKVISWVQRLEADRTGKHSLLSPVQSLFICSTILQDLILYPSPKVCIVNHTLWELLCLKDAELGPNSTAISPKHCKKKSSTQKVQVINLRHLSWLNIERIIMALVMQGFRKVNAQLHRNQ